jgi:hypothetical protein
MRRLVISVLAVLTLAFAGCGGDDSGGALDSALSYLPENATFAVALDTDTDGDQYQALGDLVQEFPFGNRIRDMILQQLEQSSGGLSYSDDIKPVLGNPFVLGSGTAGEAPGASDEFVAAIQAKDEGALDDLVEKTKPRELGEASGATLYSDGDSPFAIEDDMVVFADSEETLRQALERADGDAHFDEDAFDEGLDDLPEEALARVYADVEGLLKADPGSADALKVKWVAALRELGLTVVARDNAVDVDFRIRTEGDLSDADLPIAPGDDAPPVIKRDGEVGLGIRDLAHIVQFAENAGQSIDPAGFGDYAQAKQTIDRQLGVSLDDDVIGQLTGTVSATVAPEGGFGVRGQLKDPQAFERTLAKVSDVLPSFAEGAGFGQVTLTKPRAGGGFYELTQAGGGSVVFGVADESLVVASDRARAAELANAEPEALPDAEGSVTLSADAEELVTRLLESFGGEFGIPDIGGFGTGLITAPLGDLNGYASASTDELRGKLTLAID